ncbi:MAG TPA: succinate-semialdehyde dehydrogenase [Cryomorphaceae bacterium]|nr:succinate-semialdehyde dehydrogenase [Cryomorphaceae bacterium]
MKSINPYDLKLIREYPEDSEESVQRKLELANSTFQQFRKSFFKERSEKMLKIASDLRDNASKYAKTLTLEMGKPITEAQAEVEKCAWVCEYYAEKAEEFLSPTIIKTDAARSYVSYEPLGVILAVMPWNFPFWQVFRFAAPTVMAGNTAVLKHASNVQGSAQLIEEIFRRAGFAEGVFQNLAIPSKRMEDVVTNPIIKAASVTGSEKAGSAVAEVCGREIKTTVLELGGSNAFVIFEDADLEKAAALAVKARMINNAQSCIAAKRFIVAAKGEEEFTRLFINKLKELKEGDPMDEETQVGPLARVDLAEKLEEQLQKSIDQGAQLLYGGKRKDAHFQPTVINKVQPGMPAFDEELFGPVAPIITAQSDEEAIQLLNQTSFGLGATLVTSDIAKAEKLSKDIEDGAVFINELVKSDPRLPFGGTKRSGYGRELSQHGIHEFVNAKTVYINTSLKD